MIEISDETLPTAAALTLEQWYATAYSRLHGCLHAAIGSSDDATEALQDALVAAVANWPNVRNMESPDAWIYTVALNAHRRRSRRRQALQRLLPKLGAAAASTESSALASEIWPLVAALPDKQRVAIALRYLGGLTEPEIAAATGTTRGSISATLRSAHTRLRPQLRSEEANDNGTRQGL